MMNYVMSERYRLVRKKSLYVTFLVCLGCLLLFSFAFSSGGDREYYYFFVIAAISMASVFVAMIMSHFLTGKDAAVEKQVVAFGVSRRTIFFTKFLCPLLAFLVLFVGLLLLATVIGMQISSNEPNSLKDFWITAANLLPVAVSAFVLSYVLDVCGVGGTYTSLIIFFLYFLSGAVVHFIISRFSDTDPISKYLPSSVMNQVMNGSSIKPANWLVSGGIVVACLFVGLRLFSRKDIR